MSGEISNEDGGNARISRLKNKNEGGEEGNGQQKRITNAKESRGRAK